MSDSAYVLMPGPTAWFEFLLSPSLLKKHLEDPECDPSPTDLIVQFFANLPPLHLFFKSSKKVRALKTLALQAASHVGWDLDLFERDISLGVQRMLLVELKTICQEPDVPDELARFAYILFTRWYARSWITHRLAKWMHENTGTTVPAAINLNNNHGTPSQLAVGDADNYELFNEHVPDINLDRFFAHAFYPKGKVPAAPMPNGRAERHKLLHETKIHCPTVDCFDFTSATHDWTKCRQLNDDQFLNGALYDLGRFYFFTENFANARQCLELIEIDDKVRYRYHKIEDYLQSAIELSRKNNDVKKGLETSIDQDRDERLTITTNGNSTSRLYSSDLCLDEEDAASRERCLRYLDSLGETAMDVCKTDKTSDTEEGEISEGEEEPFGANDDLDIRFPQPKVTPATISATGTSAQIKASDELPSQDLDERFLSHQIHPPVSSLPITDEKTLLTLKGEEFMSRGDYVEAMSYFVECVALATDYFIRFSAKYQEEDEFIQRMIQCSIKLNCYTQAVVLYQMTSDINYGVAFAQLGQRHCNDCCDDFYECLWDVTILEYIVHLHTKRGEIERKTRAIQLIGQLELNENNSRDILDQAIHIRRGRFFRILAKKYL